MVVRQIKTHSYAHELSSKVYENTTTLLVSRLCYTIRDEI